MSKGKRRSTSTPAQSQTRELPVQLRAAELVPGAFNEADNTVEVVWTTGARVRRYDWWNDTAYEEELVVDDSSVDMSRFEAGAVQVLDGHRAYGGVASIMGIATRGWIENGQGRATVRLSVRDELAGIVADIRAGVIRTISVGYTVQRYEVTRAQDREDGGKLPLYRAVRWQPAEISFVPVPADALSGTRSQQRSHGGEPCEFTFRASAQVSEEPKMEDDQTPETTVDQARVAEEAAAAERQRAAEITDLCARHGVTELTAGLIRENRTVDQARAAVLDALVQRDAAAGGNRNVRVETVRDEDETRLRGMQEALSHRIDASTQLTDAGRQFRGMSLIEMGREHLERRGVNTRGMDRKTLAGHILNYRSPGLQSTSDFAHLLANVANNRLRNAYEQSVGTYRQWARRAPNAPDFKDIKVTQLSGAPELLQTNEHGEFKYGSMSDGAESYAVVTYGRIVGFTRQAIVNDDMRGFDRLIAAFGGSAARLENRLVYAQLTSNPKMSDNVDLFHAATHGNYGTTGTALTSITPLSVARKAMRLQTGLQGELLNLAPRFLIVPATLEQAAYQFTSPNYVPATKAEINEFRQGGRTALTPVIEPLLDSASAAGWYLAADSAQIDTVEYCYLDGAEGPVVDSEIGFEVDGVSYKCRLDFAAKVIDHRGLYHATGAA